MKNILVILAIFFFNFNVIGQSIKVVSCNYDGNNDLAIKQPRYDLNMDLTGVLIIDGVNAENLELRGNTVGEVLREKDMTISYLMAGTKTLNIYYPGCLPLEVNFRNYDDTSKGIQPGKTYKIHLTLEQKRKDYGPGSRILMLKSNVELKKVMVNGETWDVSEDSKSLKKLLPFGEYFYQIEAINGKTRSGKIELKNGLGNMVLNIDFENPE